MYLIDFVRAVRPKMQKQNLENVLNQLKASSDTLFLEFFKKQKYDALRLSQVLEERFLIVVRKRYGRRQKYPTHILYDSRFYHQEMEASSIWLVYQDTLTQVSKVQDLPALSTSHYRKHLPTALPEILNLPNTGLPSPTDAKDIDDWMKTHVNSEEERNISFFYAIMYFNHYEMGFSHKPTFGNTQASTTVYIEIIANKDYSLAFREKNPEDPKWIKQAAKEHEEFLKWNEDLATPPPPGNMNTINHSASVSVRLPALTLASTLGLLTEQEANFIRQMLDHMVIGLVCTYDEGGHLRHVLWGDESKKFSTQVPCFMAHLSGNENESTAVTMNNNAKLQAFEKMNQFFESLYERRAFWVRQRTLLLQPLMDRLSKYPLKVTSLYSTCLRQLRDLIAKQLVVTFSTSDQDFHALKFFMLHYIRTDQPDKKRVSISLRASTDNSIVSLVASHLSIINIHNYLDCTMEDFFQSKQQEPQKCQWPLVTRIICNTKLANQPQGYDNYSAVQHRAVQMSLALRDTYIKLDNFVWSQFGLDAFYNGTYKSLSHLGYELVLLSSSVQMGPLELGLEKTKRFYDTMYRNFSKGGFMFSAFCELKANDPLVYGGPTAQALHHYDLNSAYGHAGATSYIPNGFGVGYVKESFNPGMREPLLAIDDNFDLDLSVLGPAPVTPPTEKAKQFKGERLHRKDFLRTNSFEFKAVYATLYRLMQDGVNIERAFHNFSSFGIFYIAKYPLDLVVVDKMGKLYLYNFDGEYAHGCDTCPRLKRYVNDHTNEYLRKKSKARDEVIHRYIASHPCAVYTVGCDCHDPMYTKKTLNDLFSSTPVLKDLCEGYPKPALLDETTFLDHIKANRENKNYTFVCWAQCTLDAPLLILRRDHIPAGDYLSSSTQQKSLMLTREYVEYLLDHGNLKFDSLEAVIFYKTRPRLNDVYEKLVEQRYNTSDKLLCTFIKRLVNLSCGYFGKHETPPVKVTLTNGLPRNFKFYQHQIDFNPLVNSTSLQVGKEQYFHLKSVSPSRPLTKNSNAPLPWYVGIVENSKLRLMQCLEFFNDHIGRDNVHLLYSNVDNLVIALAAKTLTDAVLPYRRASFEQEVGHFISSKKQPGLLKEEFAYNNDWKVITARIQHLVILSEASHLKTSGIKFDSDQEAYNVAIKMLHGIKTLVTQERRIDKLRSIEMETKMFYI